MQPIRVRSVNREDFVNPNLGSSNKAYSYNIQLPKMEYIKNGLRQIAQRRNDSHRLQNISNDEDIILQSQALFRFEGDSTFTTAPPHENRDQYTYTKKAQQARGRQLVHNHDLPQLKAISNFYRVQLMKSIRNDETITTLEKTQRVHSRFNSLMQMEIKKERNDKYNKFYQSRSKSMMKRDIHFCQQQIILFVVDTMHARESVCQTAYGIKLKQFYFSCFRRNVQYFFDADVAQFVMPLIKDMVAEGSQDRNIPDGVADKCDSIRSKEGFFQLCQGFESKEMLNEIIRYFFIPSPSYRQQLVKNVVDYINCILTGKQVNKICGIDGSEILDFIHIEWNTRILFGYSDVQAVYQKLPLIEQVLCKFKYQKVELGSSLIVQFLQKLDRNFMKEDLVPKEKIMRVMSKAKSVAVVEGEQQVQPLSPFEIQLIFNDYPNYSVEQIQKIHSSFTFLLMQNEYYEIKRGLDKTKDKNFIYLQSYIDNTEQLRFKSPQCIHRIFRAADVQLSHVQVGDSTINWKNYLRIKTLLDLQASNQAYNTFLKQYFDPDGLRWVQSQKLEEIVIAIPSNATKSFKFLFKQLMINWFRQMGFLRDDDDFDSDNFQQSLAKNPIIIKYIIQWIVGTYDKQ